MTPYALIFGWIFFCVCFGAGIALRHERGTEHYEKMRKENPWTPHLPK